MKKKKNRNKEGINREEFSKRFIKGLAIFAGVLAIPKFLGGN